MTLCRKKDQHFQGKKEREQLFKKRKDVVKEMQTLGLHSQIEFPIVTNLCISLLPEFETCEVAAHTYEYRIPVAMKQVGLHLRALEEVAIPRSKLGLNCILCIYIY